MTKFKFTFEAHDRRGDRGVTVGADSYLSARYEAACWLDVAEDDLEDVKTQEFRDSKWVTTFDPSNGIF